VNTKKKPKTKLKTIPWDSAGYLKTKTDVAGYLEAVFEDGDPALVAAALGDVARSKGMAKIARSAASAGKASTRRCRETAIPNSLPYSKYCAHLGLS
jgi:probable addiction module antidote protein